MTGVQTWLFRSLLIVGLDDNARQIVTGFIIVFAVVLDTYREKLAIAQKEV